MPGLYTGILDKEATSISIHLKDMERINYISKACYRKVKKNTINMVRSRNVIRGASQRKYLELFWAC